MIPRHYRRLLSALFLLLITPIASVWAEPTLPAVILQDTAGGGKSYSLSIQILALMTVLSLLPAMLLMLTSFTRIIIVLSILRQALGTAQTPSNQILIGLSLFLSLFIMAPVFSQAYSDAFKPYMDEQITGEAALELLKAPFHQFMMAQTREDDIGLFAQIADDGPYSDPLAVPFHILMPAFLTSELKTAFQIGFILFIPFLIIDLVVASVLMAMGMMMLSPLIISLPFKLMLFVLVDGWSLVIGTLAASFVVS
ncbi:MAG: flagellar type III secretion system pore protein FliP [Gammaproteobacteria bacterium]